MNEKSENANYGKDLFFAKLDRLDNGAKAALKREFGKMLKDADWNAVKAFYSCMPANVPEWAESRWFAVACAYCAWDRKMGKTKIENRIGMLKRNGALSDTAMHRVKAMLDMDWDENGFMLLKISRFLTLLKQKSDSAPIDFKSLLDDLCFWNSKSKQARYRWAREIFKTINENN